MRPAFPATGYQRLSAPQARVVLAALVVVSVVLLVVAQSPRAIGREETRGADVCDAALYEAEVGRMRLGEGYYEACAHELVARGYPVHSVFNWRTPLPVWMLGKLPDPLVGKLALGGLSLLLVAMSFACVAREDNERLGRALACAALLSGPLLLGMLGNLFTMPVMWAGVFLAISLCGYGLERPAIGVAFGLAAVFFRELALPYALLAAVLAWRQQRRGELLAWAVGLGAWLLFFAWHWMQVARWMPAGVGLRANAWIQCGGAAFVLSTVRANAYLVLLPAWVAAVYFIAAMIGLAGWNTPFGTRLGLSVAMFVVAFGFVGQEFNQYWGCLIGPLLCYGVVRFPASVSDLWAGCSRRRQSV